MKFYVVVILLIISGCSSTTAVSKKSENNNEILVIKENPVPQLWTFQKELNGSVEVCAAKAESTLKLLGFSNITKSVYDQQTYFYANYINNRAGVHCTNIGGTTFVYGAIAGSDVKNVEILRNNIAWKF